MTNSHLMANSATLDLIKPSQVTRISAWSSETEDIIAAAVSVLINNGDNLRGEFDWDKIGAELGKKGMGTYDSYYWFRSMVHGRNAKIETSDGPTNRYPDSEALDDTGGILALKNTSELVSEATYRKVRLILGGKIRTFGNFIELNDESQN